MKKIDFRKCIRYRIKVQRRMVKWLVDTNKLVEKRIKKTDTKTKDLLQFKSLENWRRS